jgi:hypothetical protein
MTTVDTFQVGYYKFNVKKTIFKYDGRIISHTYKFGGNYEDCITISYKYNQSNTPYSASIPHLLYEPECVIGQSLEKGGGTEQHIRSAILYCYKENPTVSRFEFDDMSHIDCVEKDLSKSPPRKPIEPVNLAFFSIAYHSKTWYESRFQAEMSNSEQYSAYKHRLAFLESPSEKGTFLSFLQIAQPPSEQIELLQPLYETTATYREFFEAIPKSIRCKVLYSWLSTFMKHFLKGVFSEKGWVIDARKLAQSKHGGTRKRIRYMPKSYRLISYSPIHSLSI